MLTSSAPCSSRRGYTLTELLIALFILGLAVAIVAPALFRTTPQSELRRATGTFEAASRTARTEARLAGRDSLLTVDLNARTLTIFPGEQVFQLNPELDIQATVADMELDGDLASIRFFPEGATTGGTFLMALENSEVAIRISWITGQLERLDPDEID
jgi:general secretion pathway protein H